MKKMISASFALVLLLCFSNAFALIHITNMPTDRYLGTDYVGRIVAAQYKTNQINNNIEVVINTVHDEKDTKNTQLNALNIAFSMEDLPYGLTLASTVGKKIQVVMNSVYKIEYINIITDEYYYGK